MHKYLLEARLNGIELPSAKSNKFTLQLKNLETAKDTFRRKVAVCMDILKPQNCNAYPNNLIIVSSLMRQFFFYLNIFL